MEEEIKKEETKQVATEESKPGLRELVEKVVKQNEELIEQKKVKKWKFPGRARVNKIQAKKGFATFLLLKDNRQADFIKTQVEDGAAFVDGMWRTATADYAIIYNGQPLYILDTASLLPYYPGSSRESSEEQKARCVAGRKIVLAKLEKEAIKPKGKSLGGAWLWIILGIVGIAIVWYLLKGGSG